MCFFFLANYDYDYDYFTLDSYKLIEVNGIRQIKPFNVIQKSIKAPTGFAQDLTREIIMSLVPFVSTLLVSIVWT